LVVLDSTIAENTSNLGGGIVSRCGGANPFNPCANGGNALNVTVINNSTIVNNHGGGGSATGGGLLASNGLDLRARLDRGQELRFDPRSGHST
jgi:hypothetical protein